MTGPEVVVERHDAVLVARINRPEARNAASMAVMRDLADAVDEAEADPAIRAVVVTGTGDRAFCAGADLREVAAATSDTAGVTDRFVRLLTGDVGIVVVAAVNGVAVGAGCELALGADVVVAADHAEFGLPEVRRGLFAGSGVLTAASKLPLGVALEMTLTGERITAGRGHELGFVNRVVPGAEVLGTALAIAATIAANAPLGLAATKELVRKAAAGAPDVRDLHARWASAVFRSDDAREGATAFVEKRPPVWSGR